MTDTITPPSVGASPQQSWAQRIGRNQTWVSTFGAALLLIGLCVTGALHPIDSAIEDIRFGLTDSPATGDIVIVALDQKSRAALQSQTANRLQHAQVINKLINAGANRVGMKFDFNAMANEVEDTALLMAARMADGRLVLPVSTATVLGFNSETVFLEPFPELANAVHLGAIRFDRDDHNHVHNYDLIHAWRDGIVPSFASELVKNATVNQSSIILDYGIDIQSIKRISYIDVLDGSFSTLDIKGKYVFVGTTEDIPSETLSVPVHGTLSPIELHALAGESLLQNRLLNTLPAPSDVAIAILLFIILTRVFLLLGNISGAMMAIAAAIAAIGSTVAIQNFFALSVPIASSLIGIALAYAAAAYNRLSSKSQDLFKSAFEARERGELMNAIISTNFDSIVVFDQKDQVYFINPMGAKMLNWTVEGALGRKRDAILRLPENFVGHNDDTHATETVITRADGNELDVELAISTTTLTPSETRYERRKTPRTYSIYTFRDISERKKAESSMGDAATRAIEADRLKSEFIANMSHELRTPLNSIIGFSEVIKQELFGSIGNPHYKEYAEDIFASGKHLMSIIDDLLEVSRIASGKVELTDSEIDMERMFAECLQIIRGYPKASKKIISASMRAGCPNLIADKRAIKQILINLLSNAVKFTNEGGGVRLSAAPSLDGGVEIMISDDGIGIPHEEMGRITEAFHQIDHSDHRQNAGTGLGLHIVQSLAQLHGGQIAVTSTVNSGTQVRVIFPPERNGQALNVIPLEIAKKSS